MSNIKALADRLRFRAKVMRSRGRQADHLTADDMTRAAAILDHLAAAPGPLDEAPRWIRDEDPEWLAWWRGLVALEEARRMRG